MEERGRWITAKYRWYGFVDDDIEARSEAELAAGMMDAVQKGDVGKIIWWTSHKAVVNCEHPVGSGNTPLHEALRGLNVNVVGFLLMVRNVASALLRWPTPCCLPRPSTLPAERS